MSAKKKKRIKIENEKFDTKIRKDPTSFLPEEPMVYELKKKKKKKKKKQEDPLKDVEDKVVSPFFQPSSFEPGLDPEVNIKVENIEVELDFNEFANNNGLMVECPQSEDSQEPAVKIEPQNHDAVILTFENVVNASHVCKICHLVFQTNKTLRMHQKRKHKVFRKSFKNICNDCGMSYEQKNSLVAHIRRKHGPNSQPNDTEDRTCDICALVFKGMSRLRLHMRRKHGSFEDSFKHVCKECGLTYEKYRSLIVHIRRKHTNVKKPTLNQWFNCPFCPKIFSRRETYARHVQRKHKINEDGEIESNVKDEWLESFKNSETGEITCKECPLVFSTVHFLKLHMRRKHNALREDFKLKCKICNLSYEKVESLKRHVRRKHDKRSHCQVCNKQFDSREQYLNHSHLKAIKECSICGLIFASQGGLAKHLRCTHKLDTEKTVFCNICNAGFNDKRQLKSHLMKIHLNVSYTCKYCKKVFSAKESYRRHILFKHPVQNIPDNNMQECDKCSATFPDELELCRHINSVHVNTGTHETVNIIVEIKKEEIDEKPNFQCTKCSDNYPTWELLRLHYEQNHHTVEETQCQVCGKIMPMNELQKHIKTSHTELMECTYCEFKTTIKVSMTQHMLRHKNAVTLHCDYSGCKYKTYYESNMDKHRKKHNEVVKLQCTQCPFQTMNKYILKYHEEAHITGKKRYACDQCDYATVLPANLVQHKYKHSTEKKFKCEVCPFATKYNTSLRFHVKKKHCDLPSFS